MWLCPWQVRQNGFSTVGRSRFFARPRVTLDKLAHQNAYQLARRRDLFSGLELVFFDTTSIYFEGEGGESLGHHGYSKDHRPDLKQIVVGVLLDEQGRPICCELLTGNTADITTLIPVIDRLKSVLASKRSALSPTAA